MLFTFKRDDEGRERVYVGNVLVAEIVKRNWACGGRAIITDGVYDSVPGLEHDASFGAIEDAYGYADEAGFFVDAISEVTVDVPVPATTTTLTLVSEGDES